MKKTSWYSKAYMSVALGFLYLPILVLIVFSFNESKSRGVFTGFTLDWYVKLFHNEMILSALFNTLVIAAIASVVATVIGTLAAIGINGMKKWAKSLVMNVTYLPIINPEIVTGVSMLLLFVFIRDKFNVDMELGFFTLLLAHITFCTPYVILNVLPKLRPGTGHLEGGHPGDYARHYGGLPDGVHLFHRRLHHLLLCQRAHLPDLAHRHLFHDSAQGQPPDKRPIYHHLCGGAAGAVRVQHCGGPPGKTAEPEGGGIG